MSEFPMNASPDDGLWRRLPLALKLLAILAGVLAVAALALAIFLFAIKPPPPNLATVWERRSEPSLTILDQDDKLVMTRGGREGPIVPIAEMPDYLWQAFLAVEDRRFYQHGAIDPRGILRALVVNLRAGRSVQGGSTITQQLVKNMFLTPERSAIRKIQEAFIATWLEENLSKDAILTLYLNRIYLGSGNYGVEAAAQYYFGKSARDVTLAEAAMLAALPKAPTRYAPNRNLALAQERANLVLNSMAEAGFSNEKDLKAAQAEPAVLAETEQRDTANYFVDWVLDELWAIAEANDVDEWREKNLVIRTTYDRALQTKAELAVMTVLNEHAATRKASQAALVAMDPSGAVRAMVGGKNYAESQFNRAVQAKRQPGSTFKPFVYLAALERGMNPFDTISDGPITIEGWSPKNSHEGELGSVTLAYALEESVNTAAVRLSEMVGRANVVETARRLGIESPLVPNASIALGTSEVSLLELAGAYLPLVNEGYPKRPFCLRSVTTDDGLVLFEREDASAERVIAQQYVDLLTAMLNGVVVEGTGRAANLPDRPSAGKTGTSQDYRDAWFIGYTPQLLAGVWIGNDDNSPMERVAGGTIPALLWRNFMERALYGVEPASMPTLYALEHGEDPEVVMEEPGPEAPEEPERKCRFLFFKVRC